jgi:hypothetical protein
MMIVQRGILHLWKWVKKHPMLLGLVSIIWLALRTGTKPSRITYPCQRAALANSIAFLAAFPILAAAYHKTRRIVEKKQTMVTIMVILILVSSFVLLTWRPEQKPLVLDLYPKQASSTPVSEIFVANGTVRELVNLMGSKGLLFFKSQNEGANSGPNGLFGKDDVILIKINCQWPERGGTNTDLLKELIELILSHPDGFTGEIVVADNGQGRGSLDWTLSNSADHTQSVEDVVVLYSTEYNVSTYLWDRIASTIVQEYDQGDYRDGYVVYPTRDPVTGVNVSYPKFKTARGTYISFKYGIWDPDRKTYNSTRLKVINFPVLKSHSVYGVTAAVKHYMGVISQPLTDTHSYIGQGALGKVMVETRVPTLNILDAIWINPVPRGGPDTSYSEAVQINLVLASTDPVALDYWASKYILLRVAEIKGYSNRETLDPDEQSPQTGLTAPFGVYLRNSLNQLLAGGYQFTMDENRITVYIAGKS